MTVTGREGEHASELGIIDTLSACRVFYVYNSINAFLLWIYVGVNFFQLHDVLYSFLNGIRVNTH